MNIKIENVDEDDKTRIKPLTLENGVVKEEKKVVRQFYRQCKSEFVEENNYKTIDPSGLSNECHEEIQYFNAATHDAWIVQCPKSVNIDELVDKRIKMPGRRYVGDIQVKTTQYARSLTHAIGYVNNKGKYVVRLLPVAGHVVVSKRLNMPNPDANGEGSVFPKSVGPQRLRLPVRHPFFGSNYKTRIEVGKTTTMKLLNAEKKCTEAKEKLRSTANFYKIRQKLLSKSQTLKEKEYDVRQSVLTGVAPKFLENNEHPNYLDLMNSSDEDVTVIKEEVVEEEEEKQPVDEIKPKKRKRSIFSEDKGTKSPTKQRSWHIPESPIPNRDKKQKV